MKKAILTPEFRQQVRAHPKDLRKEVGHAIGDTEEKFGQPHLHAGIGIRKLRDDYFEIRISRAVRLVFENTPDALIFELMGNHNTVKRFLKIL